jgi:protein CpxP
MNTITKTVARSIVAAGLVTAPVAFAQSQTEEPAAPSMNSDDMQGMMQGGGDMMGMMNMMTQMNEMMQTCNQMMKAMQSDEETPAGEGAQPDNG